MISCTEFIPLYSEFFKFLEQMGGEGAVMDYWIHISDTSIGDKTNPNSLAYKCERLGGFEGAIAYWGHTLTEEACDLYKIIDRDKKYMYTFMRHCPSRGMLNDLKHIEPYHNYCEHCNVIYKRVLENYGVTLETCFDNIENASCKEILYELGNKPDFDYTRPGENAEIIDMKTEDNKYLHRDFHLLSDNAIKYCGDTYGKEAAVDFLRAYVRNYYAPSIADFKEKGLARLKEWLEELYEKEEAGDYLSAELSNGRLAVKIKRSPVIEYMNSLGQSPSEYYIEQTRTLYSELASACGFRFELLYYSDDGACEFLFSAE